MSQACKAVAVYWVLEDRTDFFTRPLAIQVQRIFSTDALPKCPWFPIGITSVFNKYVQAVTYLQGFKVIRNWGDL